jgi:hypothetical protein
LLPNAPRSTLDSDKNRGQRSPLKEIHQKTVFRAARGVPKVDRGELAAMRGGLNEGGISKEHHPLFVLRVVLVTCQSAFVAAYLWSSGKSAPRVVSRHVSRSVFTDSSFL